MSKKQSIPFTKYFPGKDPRALRLLERMLAFDPKDRPSAEEVGCFLRFFILGRAWFLDSCHNLLSAGFG